MGTGLFQPGHLLLILVIVLLVFGPGRLPELGSALGSGLRELKRALNASDDAPAPAATAARACAHCGAPAAADARYCTRCGQPLRSV
jgi:sec-independent protein translocase protein TatA